jgi:hypothetical protein
MRLRLPGQVGGRYNKKDLVQEWKFATVIGRKTGQQLSSLECSSWECFPDQLRLSSLRHRAESRFIVEIVTGMTAPTRRARYYL